MRRRQATEDSDSVLGSPEDNSSDKKKHHHRPQLNRFTSFLLLFGVVANIAVFSVVKARKSRSSKALNSPSLRRHSDTAITASSELEQSAPKTLVLPPLNSTSEDHLDEKTVTSNKNDEPELPRITIPRRLIFTYKHNLIDASPKNETDFEAEAAAGDPFAPGELLTANVHNTIEQYKKYWKNISADDAGKDEEPVVVSFLTDKDCLDVIHKAEPRLVHTFVRERQHGRYKADICRAAELYMHGGYYFDLDMKVIEPVDLYSLDLPAAIPDPMWNLQDAHGDNPRRTAGRDDIVTLATVQNIKGEFFMAFTAATPRHPVLKKSLEYMVAYYEGTLEKELPEALVHAKKYGDREIPSRKNSEGHSPGPYTLSAALRSTTDEEWEEYVGDLREGHGYPRESKKSFEHTPPDKRYVRFLHEISLEEEGVTNLGVWKDIPLQDAEYARKKRFCNYVCFGGEKVYFYSRAVGSKMCPKEENFY